MDEVFEQQLKLLKEENDRVYGEKRPPSVFKERLSAFIYGRPWKERREKK